MNALLKEGITDAIGFFGGALAGYGIGQWLGFDIFSAGYSHNSIVAIILVGLGGGLGLQLLRRLRSAFTQSR